jgi:hypothetical protein
MIVLCIIAHFASMTSLTNQVLFGPVGNLGPGLRLSGFFPLLDIFKRSVPALVLLLATVITILVSIGMAFNWIDLSTI